MARARRFSTKTSHLIACCILAAGMILAGSAERADARSVRDSGLPDPDYLMRNNRGELSHWNLGNTVGRAVIQYGDLLAVGGGFTHAGGVESPGAAFWNGSSWSAPSECALDQWVACFTVHEGVLFAGGYFTHCGDDDLLYIAQYTEDENGNWQALTGGDLDDGVWALTTYYGPQDQQPLLVAGGQFVTADGQEVNGVAKWDGVNWYPMGDGFQWESPSGEWLPGIVYALYVFDGDLYAGGGFTHSGPTEVNNIARWTGTAWEPVSDGFNAPVMALGEYQGELVTGGHFVQVAPSGNIVFYIAHLDDGDWEPYGWGTNGGVFSITNWNDCLAIGGEFNEAGGIDCSYAAQWNGFDWVPFGAGLDDNRVFGVEVYQGSIVATGGFTTTHQVVVNRIAIWPDPTWPHSYWLPLGSGLTGTFINYAADGIRQLGGPTAPPAPRSDPQGMTRLALREGGDGNYSVFFALPEADEVSLDLFDISGRRIARLCQGVRGAGEHTLRLNPEPFGSGVYFLRLQGREAEGATRMLMIN